MAETARKRFDISEESMKNGIYSCPPLEPLPSRNIPVDCFCERRPKSLISRRGTRAKRAFIIRAILGGGVDKSTLTFRMPVATQHAPFRHTAAVSLHPRGRRRLAGGHSPLLYIGHPRKSNRPFSTSSRNGKECVRRALLPCGISNENWCGMTT